MYLEHSRSDSDEEEIGIEWASWGIKQENGMIFDFEADVEMEEPKFIIPDEPKVPEVASEEPKVVSQFIPYMPAPSSILAIESTQVAESISISYIPTIRTEIVHPEARLLNPRMKYMTIVEKERQIEWERTRLREAFFEYNYVHVFVKRPSHLKVDKVLRIHQREDRYKQKYKYMMNAKSQLVRELRTSYRIVFVKRVDVVRLVKFWYPVFYVIR